MNFFSTLLIFCCLLFSVISRGAMMPPERKIVNWETQSIETPDSSNQLQVVKHSSQKKNSLYFEFFGSSANLYSLNYERAIFIRTLKPGKWARYSLRMGINFFAEKYAIPIMFHYSRGREHCFEAGAGWVPWISENKRVDGIAAFGGFRFQPIRTGLMARFGLTPTYMIQEKYHWRMIYGFSFGFVF